MNNAQILRVDGGSCKICEYHFKNAMEVVSAKNAHTTFEYREKAMCKKYKLPFKRSMCANNARVVVLCRLCILLVPKRITCNICTFY